jgi:hypothetical protein
MNRFCFCACGLYLGFFISIDGFFCCRGGYLQPQNTLYGEPLIACDVWSRLVQFACMCYGVILWTRK